MFICAFLGEFASFLVHFCAYAVRLSLSLFWRCIVYSSKLLFCGHSFHRVSAKLCLFSHSVHHFELRRNRVERATTFISHFAERCEHRRNGTVCVCARIFFPVLCFILGWLAWNSWYWFRCIKHFNTFGMMWTLCMCSLRRVIPRTSKILFIIICRIFSFTFYFLCTLFFSLLILLHIQLLVGFFSSFFLSFQWFFS